MNLLKKKTGELAPSGTSNGAIPYVNPAMKRKREEETFQKTLIQKNHPPMKLSSTNILTVTVPLKISKVSILIVYPFRGPHRKPSYEETAFGYRD